MTILIVSDYLATYEGNFIYSIKKLCEKMLKDKNQVIFVFPYEAENISWVQDLSKEYPIIFGVKLKKMLKIIASNGINVIYTHFCLPKTQCIVKLSSRILRVPLVQHWHNHYQKGKGAKGMLANWGFEGDFNIACSKSVADSLPYASSKKTYINNAIDFIRLDEYDKNFSFTEDKKQKVILMFGFDYERKGVDLAVLALKQIVLNRNIKLVISLSKNHKHVYSKIVKQCGYFPKWIEIVDARNDVATYYNAADIFLSAAREEGFCYSLIEAAYCGCNLISSEIEGVPYKNIPFCKTFESENIEDLKQRILESIDDFDINKKQQTKKTVIQLYDLNLWVNNEIEILYNIGEKAGK